MISGDGLNSRLKAGLSVLPFAQQRARCPRSRVVVLQALLCLLLFAPQASCQTSKLNQMQARDLVNKGNTCLSRRLFQEALDEYQKAIDLDPSNAAARNNIVLTHLNWGAVYFGLNKFDEAMQEWETVLKLDPYNQNAKHNINVLKQTAARRGASVPAKPPAPEKPKEEKKPESSMVILTPGLKQSQGSASAAASGSADSGSAPSAAATPAETASPPAAASYTPAETSPPPSAAPPPQASAPGDSLEDQLSAVELKIYGHKQVDMTVLKRLEKMEMDTAGQVRTGNIKERIDFLKKSYGL